MFTKIELTQKDIIGIIADHFNVKTKDISIKVENVWNNGSCKPEATAFICNTKRSWGWRK